MVRVFGLPIGALLGFVCAVMGSWAESFGSGCTEAMQEDFQRTYGDAGTSEFGAQAVETDDGGLLVVGAVGPARFYDKQLQLLRLDARGSPAWLKTYGQPGELGQGVEGSAVVEAPGGFMVSRGVSREHPEAGLVANAWLAKVDGTGDILWERSYPFDGHVTIQCLVPVIGGGFLIAGTALLPSDWQDGQIYLLLVDEAGELLWQQTYGSPSDSEEAADVGRTEDGGFLVVGSAARDSVVYLLAVDHDGGVQFERHYNLGGVGDFGEAVLPLPLGGCLIAGRSGEGTRGFDALLLSVDAAGEIQWSQTYANRGYFAGYYVAGLVECVGGGYILSGQASFRNPDDSTSSGVFFLQTDGTGGSPDLHFYEQSEFVAPQSLLAMRDHSLALIGAKQEQPNGEYDVYCFKTQAPPMQFLRGDSNRSGEVDISDAVNTLSYLFSGGVAIQCLDAADANDSGEIDISDAVFALGFLFLGGPDIPLPYPAMGPDPTEDGLRCVQYEPTGQ